MEDDRTIEVIILSNPGWAQDMVFAHTPDGSRELQSTIETSIKEMIPGDSDEFHIRIETRSAAELAALEEWEG